jgi:hypothetical protein
MELELQPSMANEKPKVGAMAANCEWSRMKVGR